MTHQGNNHIEDPEFVPRPGDQCSSHNRPRSGGVETWNGVGGLSFLCGLYQTRESRQPLFVNETMVPERSIACGDAFRINDGQECLSAQRAEMSQSAGISHSVGKDNKCVHDRPVGKPTIPEARADHSSCRAASAAAWE